jgi:hypothetical protein
MDSVSIALSKRKKGLQLVVNCVLILTFHFHQPLIERIPWIVQVLGILLTKTSKN